MAKKLTDFKTPTGVNGNLLNLNNLWQLVLGSFVLIFTFAMGQNLASFVSGKASFIDTNIEKPYSEPQQQTKRPEVI